MIGSFYCTFDKALSDNKGNIVLMFVIPQEKKLAAYKLINSLTTTPLRLDVHKDVPLRTLSSNAYFHHLAQMIGEKMHMGTDEVKRKLILDYGVQRTDADGNVIVVKLPVNTNILTVYPYGEWIEDVEEGGAIYSCYVLYKPSHLLDRAEMSRLLDGAVQEAKELDIETLDEIKLKSLVERWESKED